MIKQLLRNIQKNKLNIIRDYYENDKLSMQRKMAIKSIKSKVEEQSRKVAQNEMVITDQLQVIKRREKILGQCSALLEQIEEGADVNVMGELQHLYHKYLSAYEKKSVKTTLQRDHIQDMIDKDLPKRFEQKWLDILDDVD